VDVSVGKQLILLNRPTLHT